MKIEEQVETINLKKTTLSKCKVIGSFIGMGIVGFCFGIGAILAVKSLEVVRAYK